MQREYNGISIRSAKKEDAPQLCSWWNDGAVMAHAGFPDGVGTTVSEVEAQLIRESDETGRTHIVCFEDAAIGEMNYRDLGDGTCEIGIKICDAAYQNRGLGKIILSLFIDGLFNERGYEKIVLDTNANNARAQHVYERLGFQKVRMNVNAWEDARGVMQTSIDYALTRRDFIPFLK